MSKVQKIKEKKGDIITFLLPYGMNFYSYPIKEGREPVFETPIDIEKFQEILQINDRVTLTCLKEISDCKGVVALYVEPHFVMVEKDSNISWNQWKPVIRLISRIIEDYAKQKRELNKGVKH